MTVTLLNANALHTPLASESVQCVITSPPYYGLRDYGVNGQIGLERTPREYVDNLVSVFREVWRVLKDDGVVFLNIGDSYASGEIGRHDSVQGRRVDGRPVTKKFNARQTRKVESGVKPKDLLGIPWSVAFALRDDGWYLRSDIIWSKPNPMPESVTDRPTKAHEYIFLLSKSSNYYYDADAIAEPSNDSRVGSVQSAYTDKIELDVGIMNHNTRIGLTREREYKETRNKRTVWTVATQPYSQAHFATFPPKLVEPMILAGSAPGDLVLDPFSGSGTVGRVAIKHRRRFVGLELNPAYITLAQDRTSNVQVQMI